ncbi:hypothetical protein MTO96_027752 [Rhipicephalus appendiculatus]
MAESNVVSPPGCSGIAPPVPTPRKTNAGATGAVVGLSCAFLTLVTVFALVWFSVQEGAPRSNDTVPRETPFCCPGEVAELFGVIDKRVPPCKDFFKYVCRNAVKQGYIQQNAAHEVLWNVGAGIKVGTTNYSVQAATTFQAFYRSCVSEIWQPHLRLKSAIEAILEIANTTQRMSHAQLLHFALEVQFRYNLNLLFTILVEAGQMLVIRNLRLSNDYARFCDHACSATALTAVNAHIGANCTLEEMLQWEQLFVEDYFEPLGISMDEVRAIFGGIGADEFKAIFLEFQIDIDAVQSVLLLPETQLIADIQRLWNLANQPLSLCHVLVLLVMNAMLQAVRSDTTLNKPTIKSSEVCQAHLNINDHLWRVTRVAALTSPEKDRQMRAIFEATRRSVVGYEPLRRIMAAGNDTRAFERLVSNMSLLLPADLVLPEMKAPVLPSSGFVRNLLRLRSFEYEARVELLRRGLPVPEDTSRIHRMLFLGSGRLYVTSPTYAWLSTGTTNPLLADAPVLGSRMAYSMWNKVFARDWSDETVKAFKAFE